MKTFVLITSILSIGALSSCSPDPYVRQGQNTGMLVGGLAGGLISDSWGGAAVGAAAGGLIGGEMRR